MDQSDMMPEEPTMIVDDKGEWVGRVPTIVDNVGLRTTKPPKGWRGVSVEDQSAADERIPILLRTPATVRFLSCDPLIGAVNFMRVLITEKLNRGPPKSWAASEFVAPPTIGWCIVGGESGSKARPCDLAWVRSLVQQCKAAGFACFVRQLGSDPFDSGSEPICEFDCEQTWINKARSWLGGISGGGMMYKQPEKAICLDSLGRWCRIGRDFMRATTEGTYPIKAFKRTRLFHRNGGDPREWPDDLYVREFPKRET